MLAKRSVAVVFWDLAQAFDRVVRELYMGWPQPRPGQEECCCRPARLEYLAVARIPLPVATNIVDYVEANGT
eukprot:10906613-Lingulodinium_polyedra.AAC.1